MPIHLEVGGPEFEPQMEGAFFRASSKHFTTIMCQRYRMMWEYFNLKDEVAQNAQIAMKFQGLSSMKVSKIKRSERNNCY